MFTGSGGGGGVLAGLCDVPPQIDFIFNQAY